VNFSSISDLTIYQANVDAKELFPAISLGQFQECVINFGDSALRYPKVLEGGYLPLNKVATNVK
jgi:hypothetical protein